MANDEDNVVMELDLERPKSSLKAWRKLWSSEMLWAGGPDIE